MRNVPVRPVRKLISPLALVLGLFLAGQPPAVSAKEAWEPIAPADLAATECKAYPGSSAEVLLEKRTLTTSLTEAGVVHHYRQVKVYSPKGADESGVLKIVYWAECPVWDVAARLTKPNGQVMEFSKKDLIETTEVKRRATKMKGLTLLVSSLAAGDILEVRWFESLDCTTSSPLWWYCQDVVPVRHFVFSVKESTEDCFLQAFNLSGARRKPAKQKKTQIEFFDLPPFMAEPHMLPERDVRGWFALINLPRNFINHRPEDEIGPNYSRGWDKRFRDLTDPSSEMKAKAAELVKGADLDLERLQRLYDFCQQQIGNLSYFDSADMQKARKKIADRYWLQTAAQTYAQKSGEGNNINNLFASLAKAAGFEARLAFSASRDVTLRVKHPTGWAFMNDPLVAVRVKDAWRFYSPGDYFVPAGMLPSVNEGATSLICDPKKMLYETNPVSSADRSVVNRQGRFTLDAEGNLAGEVEISFGGHPGIERKKASFRETKEAIDTAYRADISRRLPSAEVGELQWGNLTGTTLPVVVRYHLKIPAYADLAGTKIIMPLNVFEHGEPAIFSSESRKHSISFDYAWSEKDEIEITLPAGFALEAGNTPAAVGDTKQFVGARYDIRYSGQLGIVAYSRVFSLGGNGALACKATSYPELKSLFDDIQRADEHTLVLQPVVVAAGL